MAGYAQAKPRARRRGKFATAGESKKPKNAHAAVSKAKTTKTGHIPQRFCRTARVRSPRSAEASALEASREEYRSSSRSRKRPAWPSPMKQMIAKDQVAGVPRRGGRRPGGGKGIVLRKRSSEVGRAQVKKLEHHSDRQPGLKIVKQKPHPGRGDQRTGNHRLQKGAALERQQPAPKAREAHVGPNHHAG